MKTLLPLIAFVLIGQHVISQGCNELFISEYCEGSGNNKGFEIYNPTDAPIDLGPYVLQRWSNGANAVSDEVNLVGTIPAYGTWVVVNGQTEDVDLGGGSISPAVDPLMQIYANQLDNPYPAPTYMNGDDALVFVKDGQPIDMFGKPGEDPGSAWTDNEATGYTSEDGGTFLTANKTLRRKFNITAGDIQVPVTFYALTQWDSLPSNTWDGLGTHACSCDPNAVDPNNVVEQTPIELEMYPNPVNNGVLNIDANFNITRVEIYAQNGQRVVESNTSSSIKRHAVDVAELPKGMYIVNVYLDNNATFSQRVVIQ